MLSKFKVWRCTYSHEYMSKYENTLNDLNNHIKVNKIYEDLKQFKTFTQVQVIKFHPHKEQTLRENDRNV